MFIKKESFYFLPFIKPESFIFVSLFLVPSDMVGEKI